MALTRDIPGKPVDLSKSPTAIFRKAFPAEIIQMRNIALRLGYLDDANGAWRIKGADMKLGLNIAALAYKKLLESIVLIAGDSDFVPAAKLARREGIEIILDSMRNQIRLDLREPIGGLNTTLPKNYPTMLAGADLC